MRGRQLVAGDETEEFWALKDVSFEIGRGEVVGIIGRNGAGKSTLLKVLSRITEPSKGRVEIRGRVASLLEVGTGFHPELTGRENIYLNGAILGMKRSEIQRKFDEIVAFAEVEKFLDTPVKHYSSGMYVRLAFAVAAHLEPEVLVVDEVLAVGDAEFQRKCLGKMQDVAGNGRTVLFVSHNMSAVNQLCPKSIFLNKGRSEAFGKTNEIIALYEQKFTANDVFEANCTRVSGLAVEFARLNCVEREGSGVILCFQLAVRACDKTGACLEIRIKDALGAPVGFASVGTYGSTDLIVFEPGKNSLTFEANLGELAEGRYIISLDLTIPYVRYMQRIEDCFSIDITRKLVGRNARLLHQASGFGNLCFPAEIVSRANAHLSG